jgi:hypothetical protein
LALTWLEAWPKLASAIGLALAGGLASTIRLGYHYWLDFGCWLGNWLLASAMAGLRINDSVTLPVAGSADHCRAECTPPASLSAAQPSSNPRHPTPTRTVYCSWGVRYVGRWARLQWRGAAYNHRDACPAVGGRSGADDGRAEDGRDRRTDDNFSYDGR